jgi:hypothetical protein
MMQGYGEHLAHFAAARREEAASGRCGRTDCISHDRTGPNTESNTLLTEYEAELSLTQGMQAEI